MLPKGRSGETRKAFWQSHPAGVVDKGGRFVQTGLPCLSDLNTDFLALHLPMAWNM